MCTVSKRLDGRGEHNARRDDRPTTDVDSMPGCRRPTPVRMSGTTSLHNSYIYTFFKIHTVFPAYIPHNNNSFSHNNEGKANKYT